MASHHSDPSRPRGFWNQFGEVTRGLARRIFRRGRDHERHGSLLPGTSADLPRTVKRATTIQFTTPALGDSYDFAVETECCWCASGDMTEDDLQVKIEDAVESDEIFTILMGDQVEPRREFIETNALNVVNLDI